MAEIFTGCIYRAILGKCGKLQMRIVRSNKLPVLASRPLKPHSLQLVLWSKAILRILLQTVSLFKKGDKIPPIYTELAKAYVCLQNGWVGLCTGVG